MEKEAYFTTANIDRTAQSYLDEVSFLSKGRYVSWRPSESALLVLDLQRYFLDPGSHAFLPSAPAIVPRVARLAAVFTEAHLPVYFTRHSNTPSDAGAMARWWSDTIGPDDPLGDLVEEMRRLPAMVIRKSQYDAFFQTSLLGELRGRNVRQVVVCGVMTHLCCETTARSAFVHGFDVFFAVDGTATTCSAFHRAALRNLSHGFAVPVLVADLASGIALP